MKMKRGGAEAACWAHNPKVGGSKPSLVKLLSLQIEDQYKIKTLLEAGSTKLRQRKRVGSNVGMWNSRSKPSYYFTCVKRSD